jgi:phosphatidylinositol-3-phosphatase
MRHALVLCVLAACGGSGTDSPDATSGDGSRGDGPHLDAPRGDGAPAQRTVFVIPFENKSSAMIYGNANAPYLNGLLATSAYATAFHDELPAAPSEPHYIWMEAGTNALTGHTFTGDGDATATNSTPSTAHLSTQLDAAGLGWVAYQEGITAGTCPIGTAGFYAPKHDPLVFFQDVSGSPPSRTNARCAAHHEAIASLATDLQAGTVPAYAFITPNLCHDMHGDLGCPSGIADAANIAAGDQWAAANLPALIAYTHAHDAVIFLVWDEGDASNLMPFIAIGDHVVPGASSVSYTHGSQLKTIEELLGVPVLPAAAATTDFAAMFEPGYL